MNFNSLNIDYQDHTPRILHEFYIHLVNNIHELFRFPNKMENMR